jgi:hypothetical protein
VSDVIGGVVQCFTLEISNEKVKLKKNIEKKTLISSMISEGETGELSVKGPLL